MIRRVFAWGAVAAYCGVIAWLSSMPQPPVPIPHVRLGDKLVHCGAYAFLATLAIVAAANTLSRWTPRAVALFAWTFATAFGISDEFHQRMVPGRAFEIADMVADSLGAAMAASVYLWVLARKRAARAAPST